MKKIKFSIIIPAQKIHDYLREAMVYYINQSFKDFEIIILSDINEKDKFPKTRIIKTGKVAPSRKRNIGAKLARGEILAFIDDDAYPKKDWLETANREFKDKKIVAIGGPSFPPPTSTFFQIVSNKVYEISSRKTGPRYGKSKRKEIDDWPTCNFLVRKKDFEKVGSFDEKYWGGEDTQLCYSLLKTNKKMIYNPELGIYHHARKHLKNHLKQSLFWAMWRGFFMRIHPRESIQLTFFIPSIFTLWIFFGGILTFFNKIFGWVYLLSLIFYFVFLIIKGLQTKSIKLFFPVIFVMFLTHLIYGIGFIIGIFAGKEGPTKKGMHPAEKLKINN